MDGRENEVLSLVMVAVITSPPPPPPASDADIFALKIRTNVFPVKGHLKRERNNGEKNVNFFTAALTF